MLSQIYEPQVLCHVEAPSTSSNQEVEPIEFSTFYHQHARYIAGVIYRLLGDETDLDDLVQETFLDAMRGLHQLTKPAAARAWLITIAVRKTKRWLMHRRIRQMFSLELYKSTPLSSDPQAHQAVDDLYHALNALPTQLRIPWSLHRIEECTLHEVAVICEVSLATVKRRISEAEERIQKRLNR